MNHSDFDDVRWDDYSNSTPQQEHTASDEDDFVPSPQQSAFHNGHDTNTQLHEQQDTPQPMSIIINDPLKVDNSHVAYLVKTTTTLESFSSSEPKPVRRRFQEFVWLHDALASEYPACIIPRLPNKHRMLYFKGDRFDPDFIERRRLGLQWFLDRIANHPLLQASPATRVFLESRDFVNDKHQLEQHMTSPSSKLLTSLSDALLRTFSKVKKPDDRFVHMRDAVEKLEDNLNIVDRLYTRIGKRQQDLSHDYTDFSTSIRGLSVFEANEGANYKEIDIKLRQFAEAIEAYATNVANMAKNEDLVHQNHIHELLSYCQATKDQLKERDQKQVDFEELTTYLQQLSQDRERLLHPGQNIPGTSLHLGEYVSDQMSKMKGHNLTQTRRERLARIQMKLEELQQEVTVANDVHNAFSSRMIHEYAIFNQTRIKEMKQNLLCYVDSRVSFYQQGVDVWSKALPILESLDDID